MLRSTGRTVQLKLVRYLHGFKFEQLQQAIANSTNPMASSYLRSNSSSNILQQPPQDEEEEEAEELPPAPPVSFFSDLASFFAVQSLVLLFCLVKRVTFHP